jgi:hypothetical protein
LYPFFFMPSPKWGVYPRPMKLLPSIRVNTVGDLSTNSPSKVWRWVFLQQPWGDFVFSPSLDSIPPLGKEHYMSSLSSLVDILQIMGP